MLTVTFTHVENTNAPLGVLLFKQNDGFPNTPEKALRRKIIPADAGAVTFENLQRGTYAVSVFQDLNGNKKCDTTRFGVPHEPFGVSGYTHKPRFFPRFKHAAFPLDSRETRITVRLYN